MTTALTTTNGTAPALPAIHNPMAFEPGSIPEAMHLATILFKSGLMPDGFKSPEAVVTAIIYGRELGLTAMQSIRGIHVIKGRPTMSADMMVALVKRSPLCEYFRLVSSDATQATYETKRRDEPAPVTMTYTIKEAEVAGALNKETWRAHPAPMLRARCSSGLARAVYQDLVMGVYDPDELEQAPAPVIIHDPNAVDSTAEIVRHEPTLAEVEAAIGGQDNQPPKAANTKAKQEEWDKANRAFWATVTEAAVGQGINKEHIEAVVYHVLADAYKVDGLHDLNPVKLKAFGKRLAEPGVFAGKWAEWQEATGAEIPDEFDADAPADGGAS